MKLKKAEEKLTYYLRENLLIHQQEAPAVIHGDNTIHDGREAWILHTLNPQNGVYVVFRDGSVIDFYKVSAN